MEMGCYCSMRDARRIGQMNLPCPITVKYGEAAKTGAKQGVCTHFRPGDRSCIGFVWRRKKRISGLETNKAVSCKIRLKKKT